MEKREPTTSRVETAKTWEHVEDFVREHIQQFIQALLEEEVTELLGRTKSARREAVDAAPGYRNGYGKPRRLTLTSGTITVRRLRVRDLNERFVSRVLPLFKRQTKEVGELLPQLYLRGLALGDESINDPGEQLILPLSGTRSFVVVQARAVFPPSTC